MLLSGFRFLGIMIAVRAGIRYLRADSRKRGIQYGGDQAICGDPSLREKAARIAALPYDVYNRQEAKAEVEREPESFLKIDRAETQF